MKLKVNPTRMELLKLKRRLKIAQKGHKLLKEKRDGLMKEFMQIIKDAKNTRDLLEEKLSVTFKSYINANANMTPQTIETAGKLTQQKLKIETEIKNIMSVKIPIFKIDFKGDWLSYGFYDTSSELDKSIINLNSSIPLMFQLSQIEKSAQLLATEIEKTRRRVNALEHVLIPSLNETIKYISMKLSEQERSGIATTMRIKQIIEN